MSRPGIVLRRAVVHRGEIVVFIVYGMRGNGVSHLHRRVVVQRGVIRHHAPKQRHVHSGILKQRLPAGLLFGAVLLRQSGQSGRLCLAHEKQRSGLLVLHFQSGRFQHLYSFLFRVGALTQLLHFLRNHFREFLGAAAGPLGLLLFHEHGANGTLPRLRGNAGAHRAAVYRGLGAAGVVPVYAAGRYRLKHVHVHIQMRSFYHVNLPFPLQPFLFLSDKIPGPIVAEHRRRTPGSDKGRNPPQAAHNPAESVPFASAG